MFILRKGLAQMQKGQWTIDRPCVRCGEKRGPVIECIECGAVGGEVDPSVKTKFGHF
jgi:hypothetical protein